MATTANMMNFYCKLVTNKTMNNGVTEIQVNISEEAKQEINAKMNEIRNFPEIETESQFLEVSLDQCYFIIRKYDLDVNEYQKYIREKVIDLY